MAKSIVALVPCADYQRDRVYEAVSAGIELLGGFEAFLAKEHKILLKPNMLGRAEPEKAMTTHPEVFGAVGRLLREKGYKHLSYGDSPGPGSVSVLKVAEGCGIAPAAQALNIPLADFSHGRQVPAPKGVIC